MINPNDTDIKQVAAEVVTLVNETSNDYDARDNVQDLLIDIITDKVSQTITSNKIAPREQNLLDKLYEVQDELVELLDAGQEDPEYIKFVNLVERLETYIQSQMQII